MKTRFLSASLVICLSLLTNGASAGSRNSASYAVITDTMDAGGEKASSASYSADTSVSMIGGISSAASPAETAKAGYVGQLYDITGLALAASPTNINEGGTGQLSATALLDDATVLPLPPTTVNWSVVSGPVISISSDGVATADIVYQDSPVIVRADYQQSFGTLGLTVLDVNPDNYGLYANDGLPDTWQLEYFGLDNTNAAPGVDADGTGQNNLFKYVAGLNPTNPASVFELQIENVSGQPVLTFSPCLTNRVYTVEFATNLAADSFAPLTTATQTNINSIGVIIDTNATEAAKFYRVNIALP